MESTRPKSNGRMMIATVVSLVVFAVGTYAVVEAAGGTKLEPSNSNTPNGTVSGPPHFK